MSFHDDFESSISVQDPEPHRPRPQLEADWQHWLIVVFMAAILSGSIVFLLSHDPDARDPKDGSEKQSAREPSGSSKDDPR